MLSRLIIVVVAALVVNGAPVFAHDLWIEPTTFFPQPGQPVGVQLRVGENFVGDSLPRDPALIKAFVFVDAAGRKAVSGVAGDDPAGTLRIPAPGLVVIGYHSHPSSVELPADKFNHYLKEEGLDAIAAARARRNETGAVVREHFSRHAKSLLMSGPPSDAQGDRPLGFTLELVAERNPYLLRAGQDLPLRLTYENRPLAGVRVVAMNRVSPAEKLSARTDDEGRVRFRLPPDRLWLIKAVHMERASVMSKAQWASFWASLTFDLRRAK
jgi:uncharacterized GH25 family protein